MNTFETAHHLKNFNKNHFDKQHFANNHIFLELEAAKITALIGHNWCW